jgi:hypothetical protein
MVTLAKNGHFVQKWSLWPKMVTLAKNGHFVQKWSLWPKMVTLSNCPQE